MSKRATPRRWKRFWSLRADEYFSFGRAQSFRRTSFFTASKCYGSVGVVYTTPDMAVLVFPWKRVRPMTIGEVCNPPKSHPIPGAVTGRFTAPSEIKTSALDGLGRLDEIPAEANRAENPGKTHFVGDDCPGGHYNELTPENCLGVQVSSLNNEDKK